MSAHLSWYIVMFCSQIGALKVVVIYLYLSLWQAKDTAGQFSVKLAEGLSSCLLKGPSLHSLPDPALSCHNLQPHPQSIERAGPLHLLCESH